MKGKMMPLNKDNIRGILCEVPNSLAQNLCLRFAPEYLASVTLEDLEAKLNEFRTAWPTNRFWFLITETPLWGIDP